MQADLYNGGKTVVVVVVNYYIVQIIIKVIGIIVS